MEGQGAPELRSPVWMWSFGPRYTVGLLTLSGGQLTLETATGVLLNVPVGSIEGVKFTLGGSELKFKAAGNKFRMVFTRPQGAPPYAGPPIRDRQGPLGLVAAAHAYSGLVESSHLARAWKQALLPGG